MLLLQIRERLGVSLGERPPTLVPVTHVMMCMNCGCDFSLTLRRHHCHACGKVSHPVREKCVHRTVWARDSVGQTQSRACSPQRWEVEMVNSHFIFEPGLQIPGPFHCTTPSGKSWLVWLQSLKKRHCVVVSQENR